MKNWNDIYQSVKAGEMDEKLKMMAARIWRPEETERHMCLKASKNALAQRRIRR